MADQVNINWNAADELRARYIEELIRVHQEAYPGDRPILKTGDLARLMIDVMLAAERLVVAATVAQGSTAELPQLPNVINEVLSALGQGGQGTAMVLGGNLEQAEKVGCGPHYRAALWVVRLLWRNNRLASSPGQWLLEPPAALSVPDNAKTFLPTVPLVLGVVGIVAAAVTTYYATDRICQVYDGTAIAAVVLRARLEELQMRVAKGLPIPAPPASLPTDELIDKLAKNQSSSLPALIAAGVVVVAGAGGLALYGAMKKPRASSSSVAQYSNPRRRAPARGRRRVRRVRPRARALKGGYSAASVRRNTAAMVRAGKPLSVAAAAATRQARIEYRKRHPQGPFPRHLETPAERSAIRRRRRRAKPRRAAAPPKRRRVVRRRRRAAAPKKAAAPRKKRRVVRRPAARKRAVRRAAAPKRTRKVTRRRARRRGAKRRSR